MVAPNNTVVFGIPNPIIDATTFRRDLPEARALEWALANAFYDRDESRTIANEAGLPPGMLDMAGAPSTFWASILDTAARSGLVARLIERIEARPLAAAIRKAIADVRNINQAGGGLQPTRLLLSNGRPFLARGKLREVAPELQSWPGLAWILVVRGSADSGRSETQYFLADGNADVPVVVWEESQLAASMREIWRAAGAEGEPPELGQDVLTTESALFENFWIDVKQALVDNGRRLLVMFDDLDKGPGRLYVRRLAEVLAVRLRAVSFQRCLRLVLLGYPEANLPDKVPAAFVREDTTEELTHIHVQAFFEYCLAATGKQVAETSEAFAARICAAARAKTTPTVPYVEALNRELTSWYRGLS